MNYAVNVKLILPHSIRISSAHVLNIEIKTYYNRVKTRFFGFYYLDENNKAAYIYLHLLFPGNRYGQNQLENHSSQANGLTQSSSRSGTSAMVSEQHFLRLKRYRASEIRNAPISADRRCVQSRRRCSLWCLPPNLLSSRVRLCSRRIGWPHASTTRPQRSAQTRHGTHGIYRNRTGNTRAPERCSFSRTHFGKVWYQRASSQYRESHNAQKKTLTLSQPINLPSSAHQIYETLRTRAVSGGGMRSSLTAVVYHGMLHGLMLITSESMPIQQQRSIPINSSSSSSLDPALVRLLANMVLQSQQEVMHVY